MEIRFFDQALDSDLKFTVIAARYNDQWLLCRHRDRNTWELPGGHRGPGESIHGAAGRGLLEETGVTEAQLEPVAAYGVYPDGGEPIYGGLFFAEVRTLGKRPAEFEIGENRLFETLPENMTYPEIQPKLMERIQEWLDEGNFHDQEEDIFDLLV